VSGHSRADLVFHVGDELYRVQVKWASLTQDRATINVHTSGSRLTPHGYVRTPYRSDEIELLAVYCGDVDRCYLLPHELFVDRYAVQLRLTPPRNNQRACINLAADYDFPGAVAQLGERRHGMAEVRGSIPLSSTSSSLAEPTPITVGSNPFRDRLGYWMDVVADGQEVVVTRHGKPRLRLVAA
jgi:PD-(D/E)XK endonuclease